MLRQERPPFATCCATAYADLAGYASLTTWTFGLQGELAGATAELDAVLVAGVGPVHAAAVVGRVRRVHHQLAFPQWRSDTAAGQLRDAAADWLKAAVPPEPATTSWASAGPAVLAQG